MREVRAAVRAGEFLNDLGDFIVDASERERLDLEAVVNEMIYDEAADPAERLRLGLVAAWCGNVPGLVSLSLDSDEDVRASAAQYLGHHPGPASAEALSRLSEDDSPHVRAAARFALIWNQGPWLTLATLWAADASRKWSPELARDLRSLL